MENGSGRCFAMRSAQLFGGFLSECSLYCIYSGLLEIYM